MKVQPLAPARVEQRRSAYADGPVGYSQVRLGLKRRAVQKDGRRPQLDSKRRTQWICRRILSAKRAKTTTWASSQTTLAGRSTCPTRTV